MNPGLESLLVVNVGHHWLLVDTDGHCCLLFTIDEAD
jgi:hypothetical protein